MLFNSTGFSTFVVEAFVASLLDLYCDVLQLISFLQLSVRPINNTRRIRLDQMDLVKAIVESSVTCRDVCLQVEAPGATCGSAQTTTRLKARL